MERSHNTHSAVYEESRKVVTVVVDVLYLLEFVMRDIWNGTNTARDTSTLQTTFQMPLKLFMLPGRHSVMRGGAAISVSWLSDWNE